MEIAVTTFAWVGLCATVLVVGSLLFWAVVASFQSAIYQLSRGAGVWHFLRLATGLALSRTPAGACSAILLADEFLAVRRENPGVAEEFLKIVTEHAAPGGLPTEGEASRLHSGAAPINPAPVAAEGIHRNAGRDEAGG